MNCLPEILFILISILITITFVASVEYYRYVRRAQKEYDEAKMGILFKDLPEDFKCPGCNGPKEKFKKKDNS